MSNLEITEQLVKDISLSSILIPAAVSLLTFRHYRLSALMFVLLLSGSLTELFSRYLEYGKLKSTSAHHYIFTGYCLIECVIFLWVVLGYPKFIRLPKRFIIIIIPTWAFSSYILYQYMTSQPPCSNKLLEKTGLFSAIYQALLGCLAGARILQIIEQSPSPYDLPIFWILVAIFGYCLSTFVLMPFIGTPCGEDNWYIHNSINILTNMIYFIGLIRAYRLKIYEEMLHNPQNKTI